MPAFFPTPAAPVTDSGLNSFARTLPGKVTIVVAASLFIAACAHVSIPLPFTPVPLTLSDLAVVLLGLFLSPSLAFATLILYLAEGAAGAPVFNPSPLSGAHHLVGPTGGFLFAYPFAALAVSASVRALRGLSSRFAAATISAFLGSTILMTLGVLWLGVLLHLAPATALKLGALPFLPGQAVKILAAAGIFTSLQRWRKA